MMISKYRMALLQGLDLFCIFLALVLSSLLTIEPELSIFDDYTGATLFTVFFYMLFFYILNAYAVGTEDFRETVGRVLVACTLGIISSATASYAFQHWRFDRETLLALFTFSFVLSLGWRWLYRLNAHRLIHPLRILLVGVDRAGKVRQLLAEGLPEASILGYVGEADQEPEAGPCLGPPFLVLEIAEAKKATMILLLPDAPIDDDIAHELLEAKLRGSMIVDIRSFYEHVVRRLPLSQINDEWLLQNEGFSLNTRGSLRRLKRALDVLISLSLLLPATPIMLLTALIVRLESPGPVIYKQKRVGLFEKEFTVYKFRSMYADAEKNGAVWASANDARITRFGRFIRKARIDELPQIWNILKGDMSFIGPRPERMAFVQQLKKKIPYYSLRHTIKPGLTGWAQVCYPYGASEEDALHKLEYDLYYIKNMSLLLDISIIFKTVGVVLFPKGAR
jgi:sugar transferase (PEP-CTERM system associated)